MSQKTCETDQRSATPQVIDGEKILFQENFNRVSFQFAHSLSNHPLYEIPQLLEVSKTLPKSDVYFDTGEVRVGQRWDEVPATALSVDQLIDRIENAGAWILLKRTNLLPQYGAVYDRLMADVADMVGVKFPKRRLIQTAVVLITSPNRITSYHMDPDSNFLCQLRGEKVLYVFDRYDREVVPDVELERFWSHDMNAAIYKECYQDRARSYNLKPGMGVHIPVTAPHWVKNGNNISVSLNVTFQVAESELGHVYRANHILRRWGLNPTPPGQSKVKDAMKSCAVGGADGLRSLVRRVLKRPQPGT